MKKISSLNEQALETLLVSSIMSLIIMLCMVF
jgi:hypothetical protein